jgi:hypothetical protein
MFLISVPMAVVPMATTVEDDFLDAVVVDGVLVGALALVVVLVVVLVGALALVEAAPYKPMPLLAKALWITASV